MLRLAINEIKGAVVRIFVFTLAAAMLAAGTARAAGDLERGRALAGGCRVCHGLDGQGTNPTIPNIGGQSAQYLVKQLEDFREGRRENEQMSIIAEPLTDAEIVDLAAWYTAVEVTVTPPEG